MRKFFVMAGLIAALAIPAAAAAATLHEAHIGTSCSGSGVWHFVNNQTDGATTGWLTAEFTGGNVGPVEADKVNRNTMHWTVEASGELTGASTTTTSGGIVGVPGNLVLSDVTCDVKKAK